MNFYYIEKTTTNKTIEMYFKELDFINVDNVDDLIKIVTHMFYSGNRPKTSHILYWRNGFETDEPIGFIPINVNSLLKEIQLGNLETYIQKRIQTFF